MPSDYEAQRETRVSKNFEKLRELKIDRARPPALASAKENDAHLDYAAASAIPPRGRRRRRLGSTTSANVQRSSASPARKSKRLRGEKPEIRDDETTDDRPAREPEEATVATTRRGRTRMRFVLPSHEIKAPLTLPSGVTVLELGEIHRGQWSSKYWSSTGCLFHHAYPVGYKATKVGPLLPLRPVPPPPSTDPSSLSLSAVLAPTRRLQQRHFNRMYTMWIEEGRSGPVFFVREEGGSGATFSGASPTSPWTQVCLRLRTGARISGPLHFGFSDPCVQSAIAKMYNQVSLLLFSSLLRFGF